MCTRVSLPFDTQLLSASTSSTCLHVLTKGPALTRTLAWSTCLRWHPDQMQLRSCQRPGVQWHNTRPQTSNLTQPRPRHSRPAAHRTESIFSSPLLRFPTPAADRSIAAARELHSWCTFSSTDDSTTNRCTVVSRVCSAGRLLMLSSAGLRRAAKSNKFKVVLVSKADVIGQAAEHNNEENHVAATPPASHVNFPQPTQNTTSILLITVRVRHLAKAIDAPDGLRLHGRVHERLHQDHVLRLR